MSIERTESEWSVYARCDWYQRYPDVRAATLFDSAGIAELWLSEMRDIQQFSVETVVGGRTHRMFEERSPRDHLTERGAQIVARRWLRRLSTAPDSELSNG